MDRRPLELTPQQYDYLRRGIHPDRVGRNPRGFSHVEAWDIRRYLIRTFGFGGFDIETKTLSLVREIEALPGTITYANGGSNKKTAWTVVYRAEVRLTVYGLNGTYAVYEDGATGDSANQASIGDAHDNAAKTALSQALKRCAVNLGDQFGLSLYNGGSLDPVVRSAARRPATEDSPTGGVEDIHELPADVAPPPEDVAQDDEPIGGLSARYAALVQAVRDAQSLRTLEVVWKAIGPALEAGDITREEADNVAAKVKAKKITVETKAEALAENKALMREPLTEGRAA